MAALSPEVTQLLLDRIESYEQLEVLLLLCRERSQRWTALAIGEKLRLSTLATVKALDELAQEGFIEEVRVDRTSSFTFRTESAQAASLVEELLRAYDDNCLDVIQVMNSRAMDRARSAARGFADAFVIGRRKKS